MHLIYGDIFEQNWADAICITTNGFINSKGLSVMGRGVAKTASEKWPKLPHLLGTALKVHGNNVYLFGGLQDKPLVLTFPVKPDSGISNIAASNVVSHLKFKFPPGSIVPGWACIADIEIIKRSAQQLVHITNQMNWNKVILPIPGSGAGELRSEMVIKELLTILDDRFYLINKL